MSGETAAKWTHPMKCPLCDETIRATNVEYWVPPDEPEGHRAHDAGDVVPHEFSPFYDGEEYTGDQLYYCPNPDCEIIRLVPGPSDNEPNCA